MNINYTYKKESSDSFNYKENLISLKEFRDDLVFYSSLGTYKADYALYDNASIYTVKPEIFTGGKFGTYLKVKDEYKFSGKNISSFGKEGSISFYLGTNKTNNSNEILLSSNLPDTGLPEDGEYSFSITVQDYPTSIVVLSLSKGATFSDIKNKLVFELDPDTYRTEIDTSYSDSTKIAIKSLESGKTISVSSGTQGNDLLEYLNIDEKIFGSYPESEITVFEAGNITVTHIAKEENSMTRSYLHFKIQDNEFDVLWNNDPTTLDNIEIDFDEQVVYVFINGELKKLELLATPIETSNNDIILRGNTIDIYSFDELIICNKIHNRTTFTPATKQLTKYTTEIPYIDFYFSNITEKMELAFDKQYGVHSIICDNGNYYYYQSGAWRKSDGTFNKSNDLATFKNQLSNYDIPKEQFFLRMFFFSNGTENSYLENLYFKSEAGLVEDEEGNTAAIVVGDKEFEENEKVDLTSTSLKIETDLGTTTIDFSLDAYKEYTGDDTLTGVIIGIDEIVDYINSYYPDGIALVSKDTKERINFVSETKGEEAFIKLSGTATELIMGNETYYSTGTDYKTGEIDYSEFFKSVREYIGDPLLASEVTDDQLLLYLKEAITYYKRYSTDLSQYSCQLEGNWKDGFKIPSVIESRKDILDILFQPLFPIKFYGESLVDGQEDIVTLTLANYLFGGSGSTGGAHLGGGIASDYYVSLMSIQDFKQTLGINPKWEILNGKLYIYPAHIARYTKVAIVYKSPVSLEVALTEPEIRQYVAGKALCVQAEVEGKYGGQLATGGITQQFAADSMYNHGQELIKIATEYWKSTQPPLGFILG